MAYSAVRALTKSQKSMLNTSSDKTSFTLQHCRSLRAIETFREKEITHDLTMYPALAGNATLKHGHDSQCKNTMRVMT